jgi:hypothetical protein
MEKGLIDIGLKCYASSVMKSSTSTNSSRAPSSFATNGEAKACQPFRSPLLGPETVFRKRGCSIWEHGVGQKDVVVALAFPTAQAQDIPSILPLMGDWPPDMDIDGVVLGK